MPRPAQQYNPDSPPTDADEANNEYKPETMEAWMHRPPSFVFADSLHTMLIWDTEEGGGIVTKHGIGQLPMKHAERVITLLMKKVESLSNNQEHRYSKRTRKG